MALTNWHQLCDRGPDLVLCLDFRGGRAAAGFTELAASVPVDSCFLHIGQATFAQQPTMPGQLDEQARQWAHEAMETGRPVRAVLGYCAGAALATAVADAIDRVDRVDTAGPAATEVIVFDAVAVSGTTLCDEFTLAVESSAEHLTAGELDDARGWARGLLDTFPDDLPRIATELTAHYDELMTSVANRLSLNQIFRRELTAGFTTYLAYLLVASQGSLDRHTGTPRYLFSKDHEPPVAGARNIALEVGHADLLRDPEVIKLVAELLRGEPRW